MTDIIGLKLKLASPEEILSWSYGEVIKPETINYRTQRPEKDGLFSERIFGPTRDWECYCGKYRRIRYKGVICDKCGVEVTRAAVRRERMGHIKLATPVTHIWFLRTIPSKVGLLLDVPLSKLEKVVYYISYMVIAVNEESRRRVLEEVDRELKTRQKITKEEGVTKEALQEAAAGLKEQLLALRPGQILTETEYYNLARRFGDVFSAGSGAEAIRKILERVDLKELVDQTRKEIAATKEPARMARLQRRLKLATSFLKNNLRPEWLVMTVLPVLPPDLRPMVALEGGRFATSDLNDLYRRVINRNNRLKKLLELKAPEIIITNEKRMLQEAVDSLIDNSVRLGTQQMSAQRRPLRSLADMLKGKQGRFRQNLLGKRVDYSGRSVIVVGPHLRIDQCGLPKKMALEIFKPFVINRILEQGLAHNIRNANRLIEQAPPEIWAILEEVIAQRRVLLNRAPTLHRLGVQAFEPLLIEDLAIQVPPLVCSAFNADFDGDQMAVHLPLTEEAQREASTIMSAKFNLLKPATGEPIVVPTQDIILGCYYLTKIRKDAQGAGRTFVTAEEALLAYDHELVAVNALIKVGKEEISVGRLLFNQILPADFGLVNEVMDKRRLHKLVGEIINRYGIEETVDYLNKIKELGFHYASLSGITWGMDDLTTPKEKPEVLQKAEEEERVVWSQYEQGLLTDSERRNKVIDIWTRAKDKIRELVTGKALDEHSSVYSIIDSGARGSWAQPVQMMGMKGLVVNPQNEIIELPIKTSLKEGHNVLEYFISTHGARKGTTDTALKTASAGYLARRLVDVCQDLVVQEENCRTKEGLEIFRADGLEMGLNFASRIFSRTALEDIAAGEKIIIRAGQIIDRSLAEEIDRSRVESIKVRSPITCKTLYGVCSQCYGYNLGNNQPIKIGEAVGVVAAQSISEPGTQLTMRTFHTGGVAGSDITYGLPRVEELFEARLPKGRAFLAEEDGVVEEIEERGAMRIIKLRHLADNKARKSRTVEYTVPRSSEIYFNVNDSVRQGDRLCEGNLDLKEFFRLKGAAAVQRYIINEVQRIYASEGTPINNKHIETVVRQMFSRVEITDPGDSELVLGDIVEKSVFLETNRQLKKAGKLPLRGKQLLRGITKVALSTESFLSAASFMETTRVLTNSATEGKEDRLRGLKENVIIGRLIPVGTGFRKGPLPKEVSEVTEENEEVQSAAS